MELETELVKILHRPLVSGTSARDVCATTCGFYLCLFNLIYGLSVLTLRDFCTAWSRQQCTKKASFSSKMHSV